MALGKNSGVVQVILPKELIRQYDEKIKKMESEEMSMSGMTRRLIKWYLTGNKDFNGGR